MRLHRLEVLPHTTKKAVPVQTGKHLCRGLSFLTVILNSLTMYSPSYTYCSFPSFLEPRITLTGRRLSQLMRSAWFPFSQI